ncbi:MAG TPA: adenylate/guanylate cyclase domain-containing protein [Nitrososphaerales archaeon]|nr:adenylate/guanylate cyclase domain-containing protein [Nitrososphaerales archaeon]
METSERRLSAIMFTDMVGFTSLTQSDEAQSMAVLERHNRLLRPIFLRFRGREVKALGDSFLVEFDSALDATNCAVEVQTVLHDYNISSRAEWKIALRIGVHLGDVEHREGDVFGDAVNIASRLQPLAEPEGVCISEQVFDQVRNKIPQNLVRLEPHELKGVKFAVEIYKVVMPWERQETAAAEQDRNRVAVLPFANMSPDPNDEYFADGMTEELIDRLAQVKTLRVISRTSVMKYKGVKKGSLEVAKELSSGALVEGSVRKAGNRVRVTVQLINGETEEHLWSSHYDGSLDDIFAVQSEIAEKVAGELKVRLLQSEKSTLEKRPTENMEAYGDFLRGRELFREVSEASLKQALKLFEKAVELDPTFARAHVAVAQCHQSLGNGGYESPDVMLSAVKISLRRALELDPNLADAHATLAFLHFNEDDLLGAEAEARRALELNPSLPEAYRLLHEVAGLEGAPEEMVKYIEAAYRLDPVSLNYTFLLGQAYLNTGKEQEALDHWKKTEDQSPSGTYRCLTDYYLSKGDIWKAREYYAKYEKLLPNHPWVTYMGGFIEATAGEREKALLAIRKIEERKMGPVGYNFVAYIYYALGDMDRYFEYINRATDEHVSFPVLLMYSPLLVKARQDPRYQVLVEKIKRMNGLAR